MKLNIGAEVGTWIYPEYKIKELGAIERQVISTIKSLDIGEKHCWASNKYLADVLVFSERSITRAIAHCEELGLLKAEYKKSNKGTERVLIIQEIPDKLKKTSQDDNPTLDNMTSHMSGQDDNQYNSNIHNINKDNINNKCFSFKEKSVSGNPILTEQLWINYINRVIRDLESGQGYPFHEDDKQTCLEIILYYFKRYREHMGIPHPNLKEKHLILVIQSLICGTDIIDGIEDFEIYKDMIDKHFRTNYGLNIDYNIIHFVSDTIRNHLFQKVYC